MNIKQTQNGVMSRIDEIPDDVLQQIYNIIENAK